VYAVKKTGNVGAAATAINGYRTTDNNNQQIKRNRTETPSGLLAGGGYCPCGHGSARRLLCRVIVGEIKMVPVDVVRNKPCKWGNTIRRPRQSCLRVTVRAGLADCSSTSANRVCFFFLNSCTISKLPKRPAG